jgi:hypothetical protein
MRIFFDKTVVGSSKSFMWDDGRIDLTADHDNAWRMDLGHSRFNSVRHISEAAGCDLKIRPKNPHALFWMKHTDKPEWYRILSKTDMTKHLQAQVNTVVGFMNDERNAYYINQYQRQQKLLDSLQPIKATRDDEAHGVKLNREGFASVPHYDNISSATGRMSITDGPRILTMPKDSRSIFTSRWGTDGALLEIDYNALELRVLAWIQGLDINMTDAYMWVANQIDDVDVPRHVIKESILAAMYGMSRKNFALRYQDMPDAVDVYDSVRSLLGIHELEAKLGKGDFANAFGRHLADTTARISHYVQSSAVDVACDGFMHLVDHMPEVVPCFIIHDALVIDVHKDNVDAVKKFCKDGLRVGIIDQQLEVRLRSFGSE